MLSHQIQGFASPLFGFLGLAQLVTVSLALLILIEVDLKELSEQASALVVVLAEGLSLIKLFVIDEDFKGFSRAIIFHQENNLFMVEISRSDELKQPSSVEVGLGLEELLQVISLLLKDVLFTCCSLKLHLAV